MFIFRETVPEVIGKDAEGNLIGLSEDGAEIALDLSGYIIEVRVK